MMNPDTPDRRAEQLRQAIMEGADVVDTNNAVIDSEQVDEAIGMQSRTTAASLQELDVDAAVFH
jgi:hypothetical protein